MPTILPKRNYSDHDVIQEFTFNPTGTYPAVKGTFVKILSGVMTNQNTLMAGSVGAQWANTVSQRYGIQPYVGTITNSGDNTIGMLLYDVRETDENGEKLIYHPDKQDKMQAVLSGQPVPIVTKGTFVYSGVAGTPVAGAGAYLASDGSLSANGAGVATRVGTFLGPVDANGNVYLKLNIVG